MGWCLLRLQSLISPSRNYLILQKKKIPAKFFESLSYLMDVAAAQFWLHVKYEQDIQ